MSYIKFDKSQLINLEFSLRREILRSNRAGSYASFTLAGCNTRKYHGLLVTPQPGVDEDNHVLLANLDETVIQHNTEFYLGIHKYPGGVFNPKGHQYLREFAIDPIPYVLYRVGGVMLKKEMIFTSDDRLLIRYTLVDAHSPTTLRLNPFLAFRSVHKLTRANIDADTKYQPLKNGIKIRMYPGYSYLHMQTSKKSEYVHVPHWYYNVEYQKEMERGYEYQEDLFVPGFFEFKIKKNESVIFAAGLSDVAPASLSRIFENESKKRTPRDSFENCLLNAAEQFILKRGHKTEIISGFPWFGRWARDTFISLPGLTMVNGDLKTAKAVLDNISKELTDGLFPNLGMGHEAKFNSADASLWYFWTLQQYSLFSKQDKEIWKDYGKKLKSILESFRSGTHNNIKMQDDGLLYVGQPGMALTWMDAIVDGKPVTPRIGKPVEINALWYNAIMFTLELAKKAGDRSFVKDWKPVSEMLPASFMETFWDEERGYLADYVCGDYKDWSVRPNMVIATSLPYVMVDEDRRNRILTVVKNELLTKKGLRSLSPNDPNYKGFYYGDQRARDLAYHQGSAWPWLAGHFVEGYLKIHGKSGLHLAKSIYLGFEDTMTEHGLGTVSEIYDGDPPHRAAGAISQAWNVAELLRMKWLIDNVE